jgi:predicted ATPase
VQSVFESVDAAGGYFVVQKFDETKSQSPLSVVLSALNDLCGLIVEKHSHEELRDLHENIKDGTNLTLLSRVVPNVTRINSSDTALHLRPLNDGVGSGLNFHMLVFAIMRLMRIISGLPRPVMIFLDDLQWADTASLDLVHAILSDVKGSNCVLFVGSYRDQDVKQGHFVFEFIHGLSAYEVPCTELHLDGLTEDHVNHMLSDILCVIPRLCKSLSNLVFQKTRGSPFFVIEILNSLIDRGIVSYSLRERRWCWDIDQIGEEDITDNVLQMIHDKMSFLGDDDQTALEVASCFGIEINESIVRSLSETRLCSDLQFNLDKAVENGFMEREGSKYRFIHDKVREAAYSLIDSKDEYHYNIGMALYSTLAGQNETQDWNDRIPTSTILAQINHGVPSLLTCEETRSCIAELNYKESVAALESSDFTSAYFYMKAAVSLLPEDPWTNKYDQSIEYFFQFAKAAYPCGYIGEAKDSLNTIIENGRGLEETYPSYFLLTKVLFLACKELSQAFETCRKLLLMLGEDVPVVDMVTNHLSSQMTKAQMLLKDSAFLTEKQVRTDDWRSVAAMQAYDLLVTITFMSHPNENSYYVCRWAEYTLVNKVSCRYTPKCIVSMASILCRDLSLDTRIGYKRCKQALVMLDHSYLEDVAEVFLIFYGFIGVLFEPLQACLDMHCRGYEMAMQVGASFLFGVDVFIVLSKTFLFNV